MNGGRGIDGITISLTHEHGGRVISMPPEHEVRGNGDRKKACHMSVGEGA